MFWLATKRVKIQKFNRRRDLVRFSLQHNNSARIYFEIIINGKYTKPKGYELPKDIWQDQLISIGTTEFVEMMARRDGPWEYDTSNVVVPPDCVQLLLLSLRAPKGNLGEEKGVALLLSSSWALSIGKTIDLLFFFYFTFFTCIYSYLFFLRSGRWPTGARLFLWHQYIRVSSEIKELIDGAKEFEESTTKWREVKEGKRTRDEQTTGRVEWVFSRSNWPSLLWIHRRVKFPFSIFGDDDKSWRKTFQTPFLSSSPFLALVRLRVCSTLSHCF